MSIMQKIIVSFFCFLFTLGTVSKAQNIDKETIYIFFKEGADSKKIDENGTITFLINSEQFIFDSKKEKSVNRSYNSVKDSLISISEAKEKVSEYLERKAEEKKKEAQDSLDVRIINFLKSPGIYYYNSYFNKIYVYELVTADQGVLYPVKWNWYIE